MWISDISCHSPNFGLVTKAKRLQGCELRRSPGSQSKKDASVWVKKKPRNHITYSWDCKKMWRSMKEWTLTLPRQLPLWEMESRWTSKTSESNFKGQNSMTCDVLYIIGKLLELRCLKWACITHLDIWNTKLWPKEGPEVKLPVWLPTKKSQESTWFTWLQRACDIPLESSWRELQLCFRPHLNLKSTHKVMGLQSHANPKWSDFGTPIQESRERKTIWM